MCWHSPPLVPAGQGTQDVNNKLAILIMYFCAVKPNTTTEQTKLHHYAKVQLGDHIPK